MPFQLSPGVSVIEKDFTSIVPAVSTSVGAFAGSFSWGPIEDPIRISSENELVDRFGAPTDSNFASFFTAANFLSYSNNMIVARIDAAAARNAVAIPSGSVSGADCVVTQTGLFTAVPVLTFSEPQTAGGVRTEGVFSIVNNALVLTITNPGSGYTAVPTVTFTGGSGGTLTSVVVSKLTTSGVKVKNVTEYLNSFSSKSANGVGEWAAKFAGTRGNGVRVIMIDSGSWASSFHQSYFQGAPGTSQYAASKGISNDEVHIIVFDNSQGSFSGVPNSVLETYSFLSKLSDAKKSDGSNNYYKGVVNSTSRYVWWMSHPTSNLQNVLNTSIISTNQAASAIRNTTAFTGYIQGNSLVVSNVTSGGDTISVGSKITGTGVTAGTYVTDIVSGSGGVGVYTLNRSLTVGSVITPSSLTSVTDRINLTGTVAGGILSSIAAYKTSYDSWSDKQTRKVVVSYTTSGSIFNAAVTLRNIESVGGGTITSYNFVVDESLNLGSTTDLQITSANSSTWGVSSSALLASSVSTLTLLSSDINRVLAGGVDSFVHSDANYQAGFALFQNTEEYDVSLMPLGDVSATVANYVVSTVLEPSNGGRGDCMAFISPRNASTGAPILTTSSSVTDIKVFKSAVNVNTSYAVMDTGCKYQYDRYNDTYRWIPLNGDIAGLCARTDYTADAWFSPGGFNRGVVKNVVKLGFNPRQAQRDELYVAGINPVVTFPGQGTILFGDKTMLTKPSAFDRINVRRLFIVLEKAIASAARFQMFEFNDGFTRAQFKNLVEPFLRDVQGRRGITDFKVVCDDTNNTGEVIDRNEFVANIFIKPNRSINFITLNFIAARSSVSFEELGA
jgi:phage tail sheath protein FI